MSEENVEIVRQGLEAMNAFLRGEMSSEAAEQAVEQFADPEIEFHWHAGRTMPDEPQYLRGAPAILEFWEQLRSAWDDLVIEPLEFTEGPEDRVLVLFRQSGRGRESGVPVEIHGFDVFAIRGGKVLHVELFRHRADALEAAGLRE